MGKHDYPGIDYKWTVLIPIPRQNFAEMYELN